MTACGSRSSRPDIAFPVVWTMLYALMAVALWRTIERVPDKWTSNLVASAFMGQLSLNVVWPYAFFVHRQIGIAFLVILALIAAILINIRLMRPIDGLAAKLMLPYLAWVCFAALLNASIWWLNA